MRRALVIACAGLAIGALVWGLRSCPPAQEAVIEPVPEGAIVADETPINELGPGAADRSSVTPPASRVEGPLLTVRGRVVDEQSRPMADVEVAFLEVSWTLLSPNRVESLRAVDAPHAPTFQGSRTAEDGRFELIRPAPDTQERYHFVIGVQARGMASMRFPDLVPANGMTDMGDLFLRRGVRIAGFVRDANGAPCANALVESFASGVPFSEETRSAPNGSFALQRVLADRISLNASTDDHRGVGLQLDLSDGLPRLDVEIVLPLVDGTDSISGIVLDPEGRPSPRATLHLRSEADSSKTFNTLIQTHGDGRFRIDDSEGAVLEIVAKDLPGLRYGPARATGVRGGTHGLELRMVQRAEFMLRVIDDNDRPITQFGFDVSIRRLFPTSFALAEHPRGEARVPLDVDPFGLRVFAPGFASKTLDPLVPGQFADPLVVPLPRAARVRGEVRGKGSPLAMARVTLARENYVDPGPRLRAAPAPSPEAITDSNGRFDLTIERAGTISLRAMHFLGSSPPSEPIEVRPGSIVEGIVLEVDETGAIRASVLRHDGQPAANLGARVVDDQGAIVATAGTDGQGGFSAAGLAPGHYRVRIVNDAGFLRLRKESRDPRSTNAVEWPCEVAAGTTSDIAIRLQAPTDLQIHLELPELVGGRWSVAREFEDPFTGDALVREETHRGGAFDHTLKLLDPTACTVSVEAEIQGGIALTCRKSRLERGHNSITLAPGFGRVRGRVDSTLADGRTMRLNWANDEWRGQASIVLGPDGAFEFPCAPAGACELSFEEMPPRKVTVNAGELTDCGEW
ncbi:MAG: carboxypeptidase regulatory-like domain-containing protein [Planctomycetes bacterium]|nr:carboxypeptidase regulatory-like domain-containing protein [Planctomycetota bacterium]